MFGSGFSGRMARRYRRRGLDRTATRMVDFLAADGLADATVLEIGGGVGEIGLELLRRGAATVVSLELSTAYDQDAHRLAYQAEALVNWWHARLQTPSEPLSLDEVDLPDIPDVTDPDDV